MTLLKKCSRKKMKASFHKVVQNCLFLKWSAIVTHVGLGFSRSKTNCGHAHIFGYPTDDQ